MSSHPEDLATVLRLVMPDGIEPATPEQMVAHAEAVREEHDRELAERLRVHRLRSLEDSGVNLAADDYPAIAEGRYDAERLATAFARKWWSEGRPGSILCLLGDVGRGKTFAAATLLAEYGGRAVRSSHLARLAASKWGPHGDEFREALLFDGLLLVDEAGKTQDADAERAMLLELVDTRYGRGRTVITCNRSLRPVKQVNGGAKPGFVDLCCSATLSRLHACGTFYAPTGDDLRKRGAQ